MSAQTLRFVTFLAPNIQPVYEAMAAYVGRTLGMPATLTVGTHDYDVFARGEADFGFI
jgi:hypothetical protein